MRICQYFYFILVRSKAFNCDSNLGKLETTVCSKFVIKVIQYDLHQQINLRNGCELVFGSANSPRHESQENNELKVALTSLSRKL